MDSQTRVNSKLVTCECPQNHAISNNSIQLLKIIDGYNDHYTIVHKAFLKENHQLVRFQTQSAISNNLLQYEV